MVVIVLGVAAAGKSTVGALLAKRLGWEFHDADDYHPLSNIEKMRAGLALDDEDRRPWLDTLSALVCGWLRQHRNAVLACSALRQQYRDRLVPDPRLVRLVYLRADPHLAMRRITSRHHPFMNPSLLRSQFDALQEPADALVVDAAASPESIVELITAKLDLSPA